MGIVGTDRMLVVALSEPAEIGGAIMADRLQRQFGQSLLDLAALDLEQARFGSRPLAGVRTGEPAQLGEFKRGQIDLQLGDLALAEGVEIGRASCRERVCKYV